MRDGNGPRIRFERYNLRETEWNQLRQTPVYTTVAGARHLRPTDVADRELGERYSAAALVAILGSAGHLARHPISGASIPSSRTSVPDASRTLSPSTTR